MKNRIWNLLNVNKSIRGQMLWTFVSSLLLTILVVSIFNLFDKYIDRPRGGLLYIIFNLVSFYGLFLFFFLLLTRSIVGSFRTITAGLQSISNGNLNYRLPLSRQDELGTIAQNINQMTEQLQTQMERERQLEKSKMELITSVSHDLRTPLTSIIGYLDLLKNHTFEDTKEQERYIENAFNKTQQLKKLIDDLFEYTRLTDGNIRLVSQEVDFKSLLKQIITEFEPVAKEQGISVIIDLPTVPVMVCMDIELMVRAIDNLLMNAFKFSLRPGEIRLALIVLGDQATLSIENQGKPITQEQEKHLFEKFYKMEPSRSDKNMAPGFGLGLSIAKNIVELHSGRIWLEYKQAHYKFCIELSQYSDKTDKNHF